MVPLDECGSSSLDILRAFMKRFASKIGLICTDQGGELAQCGNFWTLMLAKFNYLFESTGADSPSQNNAAEIYNKTLAMKVCMLLYGWPSCKILVGGSGACGVSP